MNWQRGARLGVAVVGLGTAVALYVLTRERPPQQNLPPMTTQIDPTVTSQSGAGVQVSQVNDTERYRMEFSGTRTHQDGHIELDGVHILFKKDSTEIWAGLATMSAPPKGNQAPSSLHMTKHVRLKTGEGASVEGDSATYDDAVGITNMPGPVTFTRGRMSGSGEGAIYERDTGVFRLLAQAHMTTLADTANPDPVDATAETLVFNRATRAMQFDKQARIAHGADVMTADRSTLYLSEDEQQFQVIELRGSAAVMPAPGKTSASPEMHAQDIDLGFYPGTQVLQRALLTRQASMVSVNAQGRRAVTAGVITLGTAPDGTTVTKLDAHDRVEVRTPAAADVPERVITAPVLVSTGDDKIGLTSALFSGGVSFVETLRAAGKPPAQRTGTAQMLTLKLKGQLDAIDEAEFQRDVSFKDSDVSGRADIGTYFASAGKLTLKPDPRGVRRPPNVTSGDITVDAREYVEVDLNTQYLHARGDVKTVTAAAKPGATASNSLFTGTDSTIGFGTEFWYEGKQTRYAGVEGAPASISQGDSRVAGLKVLVGNETHDLSTSGAVDSTFLLTDAASTGTKYRLTADSMEYKESERRAVYRGVPARLTTTPPKATVADGDTTAKTIVLILAKESRSVERLDAQVDVYSKMKEGREAVADTLVYESGSGRYTLTGKAGRPVRVRSRDKNGKCSETIGRYGYFVSGQEVPSFPAEENPGGFSSGLPCTGSLN
ncbi:MAG: LptA/OstA family protein [Vicinamibacterales bacterium]